MQKHLLRTLVLSSVLCLMSFVSHAQWVSIPDTAFVSYLQTTFPTCMNGNLMDTTCSGVMTATNIQCPSRNIKDLTGIQYFDSLLLLNCNNNGLVNLPGYLPPNLTRLDCLSNLLDSLPPLPESLKDLNCQFNALRNLPPLAGGLQFLNCEGNLLSNLPGLPSSLRSLNCNHNMLTVLPTLPIALTELYCRFNQLTRISTLPDSLTYLICTDNPDLYCLPHLKKINYLYFDNTGVSCLRNYPQSNLVSHPALNSLPLCEIFNSNGCDIFWNINGKVFTDEDSNCYFNLTDTNYLNTKVRLYKNGNLIQETFTVAEGNYYFDIDSFGTYSIFIDTADLPFYVSCPDSSYYTSVINAQDTFDVNMNFGLECKSGFDIGVQSITGRFRPGNLRQVDIHAGDLSNFYKGNCAAGIGGTVTITITGSANYISPASGALTPSNANGKVVTWNVVDFGVTDLDSSFNIMVQTDTTALIGDEICFSGAVTPTNGDNNPINNFIKVCFVIVGSFDPNEKEVYPAGNIDTATKWLTYTIHFQNTGTAEAQHIYLTDTLDNNIDAGSFQLLAYSHQPMVQLKGNNLRFNFPNINLPDSNSNEPASHGYVQYKVKLQDNLPIGTSITNTAFIYFDFNAPVVTNTTNNTITTTTGISTFSNQHSSFSIYPNPATESVRISVDESMIGSSLTITDVTGRRMTSIRVLNSAFSIPTSAFASGLYFVTLETKTGRATKKLVKQ